MTEVSQTHQNSLLLRSEEFFKRDFKLSGFPIHYVELIKKPLQHISCALLCVCKVYYVAMRELAKSNWLFCKKIYSKSRFEAEYLKQKEIARLSAFFSLKFTLFSLAENLSLNAEKCSLSNKLLLSFEKNLKELQEANSRDNSIELSPDLSLKIFEDCREAIYKDLSSLPSRKEQLKRFNRLTCLFKTEIISLVFYKFAEKENKNTILAHKNIVLKLAEDNGTNCAEEMRLIPKSLHSFFEIKLQERRLCELEASLKDDEKSLEKKQVLGQEKEGLQTWLKNRKKALFADFMTHADNPNYNAQALLAFHEDHEELFSQQDPESLFNKKTSLTKLEEKLKQSLDSLENEDGFELAHSLNEKVASFEQATLVTCKDRKKQPVIKEKIEKIKKLENEKKELDQRLGVLEKIPETNRILKVENELQVSQFKSKLLDRRISGLSKNRESQEAMLENLKSMPKRTDDELQKLFNDKELTFSKALKMIRHPYNLKEKALLVFFSISSKKLEKEYLENKKLCDFLEQIVQEIDQKLSSSCQEPYPEISGVFEKTSPDEALRLYQKLLEEIELNIQNHKEDPELKISAFQPILEDLKSRIDIEETNVQNHSADLGDQKDPLVKKESLQSTEDTSIQETRLLSLYKMFLENKKKKVVSQAKQMQIISSIQDELDKRLQQQKRLKKLNLSEKARKKAADQRIVNGAANSQARPEANAQARVLQGHQV